MRTKGFLFAIIVLSAILPGCRKKSGKELVLEQLDRVLEMKETYEGYFVQRVNALKSLATGTSGPVQEYDANKHIAEEYLTHSLDSAVAYLEKNLSIAESLHDSFRTEETDLMLVKLYAKAGYISDAENIAQRYSDDSIPEGLEYQYYEAMSTLYGELGAYSSSREFWVKRNHYLAALKEYIGDDTFEGCDILRTEAVAKGQDSLARAYAMKMLELSAPNSKEFASAAFFYQEGLEDQGERIQWLAKSAIADMMTATRDYASLNILAQELYNAGDFTRAFRYSADHCMRDAIYYNGKLRPWQVARFFPQVENKYEQLSKEQTRRLRTLSIVAVILVLLLGLTLFLIVKRQRVLSKTRKELEATKNAIEQRNDALEAINTRLQALNSELSESNKVKQEYITLFLGYLSENISTARQYKNHVLKYIRRGNAEYLKDEIEAMPPIDEDIQEFYRMFDRTFVNLYPGFVDKFNALLAEGEAIVPKGDDILTPELRVFALIKLGIVDSSSIATLLHYSANTIYNYRAKVKNKAKGDRDSFEAAVKAIE